MWGTGQRNKVIKYGGPRRDTLSMGPKCPCYTTAYGNTSTMGTDNLVSSFPAIKHEGHTLSYSGRTPHLLTGV